MKKSLYLLLTILTCITFMTGCSFFKKADDSTKDDSSISSEALNDTTDQPATEEDGEELPVDTPQDATSEDVVNEKEDTPSKEDEDSNPRDNVASNTAKEYTATGKYCGFIDSISVEIELSDGSCCTFFVYDDDVRSTLSALDEEDMPEISFSYKAKEGQINPEMTSVIGG